MCLSVTYHCVNYYFYSKVYRTLKLDMFGTADYVLSSPFHCVSNLLFYPLSLSQLMTPTLSTQSPKPRLCSHPVFSFPHHTPSPSNLESWWLNAFCHTVLKYSLPGPKSLSLPPVLTSLGTSTAVLQLFPSFQLQLKCPSCPKATCTPSCPGLISSRVQLP